MDATAGSTDLHSTPAFSQEDTHVSGRRFVAHFVDGLIYTVAFVVVVIAGAFLGELIGGTAGDAIYIVLLVVGLTVGHAWFLVVLHGSTGRTPGKRVVGIRVVDAAGNPPTRSALWKRSLPVIIEYVYIIAWIGMMASDYRQRFGDRWGHTYVIAD